MGGHRARKRFGQNFLQDKQVVQRIVDLVAPSAGKTIVEIGPGRGVLTLPLAESGANVIGVEFDRDLMPFLRDHLGDYPNVRIENADFLDWSPAEAGVERFTLAGNIPYNITSPVLEWCVKHAGRIERAVLMMQREVAARVTSGPGGHDWSPLAIFTRLHYRVEHCFDVSPKSFRPKPKVWSTVIRLEPDPIELGLPYHDFERVVRAAFRQRRKILTNNLSPEVIADADELRMILDELGLPSTVRAEELSIDQFLELTHHIRHHTMN